jgi:Amt family ammonium transporter
VGAIFLVFFIRDSWMASAAEAVGGSWSIWQQLGVQAAAVGIAIGYAVVVTFIILFVMKRFGGLRASADEEMEGLDRSFHGERGYGMLNPN